MATIVIVGGGTGGLSAAIALKKGLGNEHKVIVVERECTQYFPPSLLWVMDGRRTAEAITRDIEPVTSRGIILELNEATDLDLDRRTISTRSGQLSYDFLIFSPGIEYDLEAIPGLKACLGPGGVSDHSGAGFNLYTMEGVLSLRGALRVFQGGDVAIVAPPGPYRCPPVAYEAAMLLDSYFQRAGKRDKVRISVFTPEYKPFEFEGKQATNEILRSLRNSGITHTGGCHLTSVDPGRRLLRFREGTAQYDLLVCIPPHSPPAIARRSRLSSDGGFVHVDPNYLRTSYENVYAIGDVAEILLPSGVPIPKMGAVAHLQSLVVAGNIIREITGKGKPRSFSGTIPCIIEIGKYKAFVIFGNLYNPAPRFRVLPRLPIWTAGKVLIERNWLRERASRG